MRDDINTTTANHNTARIWSISTIASDGPTSYVDWKLYLEHTLPAPVSGRTGVWSKADSVVYFADYQVIRAAP
jgi:hypothetical protein